MKEVVLLKNLRRDFERFCYRNANKGIPNLMMFISLGTAIMYLFTLIDPSNTLYFLFSFHRGAILHGQIWRLFTYILLPTTNNVLILAISLYFYYFIGKTMENQWGTFRFNLFYFSGVLLTDIAALLFGFNASIGNLNLSLMLAFATLYPENRVLLFYIIPIKMKYLAWFYFALIILDLFTMPLGYNLFSLMALLNYFLFFGSDILGVLPDFMQPRRSNRSFGDFGQRKQKPNANWASHYRAGNKQETPPYRHKCTVCGRTDVDYPDLEFRYCSQCNGYYCYCIDHINNHEHIK